MKNQNKKLRIYLANLGIEVPVESLDKAGGKATVLVSDIPVKIARDAGLVGQKTATYWYGPNAGGNKLVEVDALTDEQKKAKEFVEAAAQAIIDVSDAIHKLLDGKLKKSAIVLLIQEAAGGRSWVSKEQVEKILTAIENLDKTFTK